MEKRKMTEKEVMDRVNEIRNILDPKEATIPNGTSYHTLVKYKYGDRIIQTANGEIYLDQGFVTQYRAKSLVEAKRIKQLADEKHHYLCQLTSVSRNNTDLSNPNG